MNIFLKTAATVAVFALTASASVIVGPALTVNGSGNTNHGIAFTALGNSILTSFVDNNQGLAGLVTLTPAGSPGTVLFSVAFSATGVSPSTFSPTVSWALTSGTSYWLLGTVTNNGRLSTAGQAFPVGNADISVTSGVLSSITGTTWADFTNITTTATPEPSSSSLLIIGAVAFVSFQFSRRKALLRTGPHPD